MKCPKCAYVGFEPAPRCRHCGYEFSLLPDESALVDTGSPGRVTIPALATLDPVADLPLNAAAAAAVDRPLAAVAERLPSLFTEPPPAARAPLAVRKTTSERPRSRATGVGRPRPTLVERPSADSVATGQDEAVDTTASSAPVLARGLAAALDLVLLAGLDVVILYLTLQLSRLSMGDLAMVPLAPMLTFVGGLNLAYFAIFTTNGGQTLGKMATGVRVEGVDGAVTPGGAMLRVAVAMVGGLLAGAGWWMLLARADRRAAHDHFAGTRVVKVPA